MMKSYIKSTFIIMICSSLVACADLSKQDVGVISGGAIGGLIGSQFGGGTAARLALAGVGAVAGAAIGGAIGHAMDRKDQMLLNRALENQPTGQTTSWKNPDTGNRYSVTPTKTYRSSRGPCRKFLINGIVNGRPQQIVGRACRKPNGTWQMVN